MFRMIVLLVSIILASADAMREANSQFFPLQQSSHLSLRGNDRERTRVVALYRGVNFCSGVLDGLEIVNSVSDYVPGKNILESTIFNEQKRADYISNHVPGENILESLHIKTTTRRIMEYNEAHNIHLDINKEDVQKHQIVNTHFMFQRISGQNKIKNNMVLRATNYEDFHKDYSNHYSSNNGHFDLEKQNEKYDAQFKENPFLSFSKNPKHAVKYAYGINKSYAGRLPLTAQYASDGSLQVDTVGVVQVVFVREEDLLKLGVCDVNKEIGRPWRRIGNENEVSLDGYAFSENFVLQIGAKLPSLTEESRDCNQLGFRKGHWRRKLIEDRADCARSIEKSMVPRLEKFINSQVKNFAEENEMDLVQLEDLRRP